MSGLPFCTNEVKFKTPPTYDDCEPPGSGNCTALNKEDIDYYLFYVNGKAFMREGKEPTKFSHEVNKVYLLNTSCFSCITGKTFMKDGRQSKMSVCLN